MYTKKTIRESLAPMSKSLLRGHFPAPIEFMGYRVECHRLYNNPGTVGYSWNPSFSVYARDPDQERAVMGGRLDDLVDAMYRTQNMKREGFKFIKAA